MVFSTPDFLFYFLPVTLLGYYALPWRRARNAWLLLASLIFYLLGGGVFILVLLASTALNYALGLAAARYRGEPRRKLVAVAAVAVNLLILGVFKYFNFFMDQADAVAGLLGREVTEVLRIALPIGISFYTFHALSYVFDILRGVSEPKRNPLDFALYIALFPQLVAGPIVRFNLMEKQLDERGESFDAFSRGALRFTWGLIKKLLIADQVGMIAEAAFEADTGAAWSAGTAWLALLAYTVQIYFDFSAYSDMAIGLGLMFGFRLPENFARPYSAVSVTDFWRRWHMTLSNWFRDYLYIPLGGSRGNAARTAFNLVVVFFLTGFWHGAAWTFVLWGGYHGALLIIERVTGLRRLADDRLAWLRRPATLLLVTLGWALFRADDLGEAGAVYAGLLSFSDWTLSAPVRAAASHQALLILAIGLASALLPRGFVGGVWVEGVARIESSRVQQGLRLAVLCVGLPLALAFAMTQDFSPFLYYQF